MAEGRIGRAVLEITVDDRQYKLALDQVAQKANQTATHVRGIGQAVNLGVFREFASVGVNAVASVARAIVDLGMRGADIGDVAGAFGTLSEQAGETAATMLGELRAGTAGVISDFELMKMSNVALGSGLVSSADDMGTLAAGARSLAQATGRETSDAFQMLTGAIARGRTGQLAQLGLFVDSKVATENFARANGLTVSQLTDAQRAQALSAATLQALRDRIREMPPAAADFGEMIAAAKVKLENFRDGLAVGIAQSPVFAAGMGAMGQALDSALGPNQAATITTVVHVIEALAIKLVEAGQVAVWIARQIMNAWEGLKLLFNATCAAIAQDLAFVVSGIARVLEVASQIPGIGGQFAGAASFARAFADDLALLSTGFIAQGQDALDSAASTNAALDTVNTALGQVKTAMIAARQSSTEMATGTRQATTDMGAGAGEAAARTEEATGKIRDAYTQLHNDIVLSTKVGVDRRLAELEIAKQQEILKLSELKGLTQVQYDEMVLMVQEKYRLMSEAARLSSDEIRDRTTQLQQELQLAQTTGTEQRLLELEFARQREIEGLATLRAGYGTEYATLVAMVNQKYGEMTAAARGHFATVQQAAAASGFQTRAELVQTAENAEATYARMRESGLYTEAVLTAARERAEEARRAASSTTEQHQLSSSQAVMQGTIGIMEQLGRRYKAAAIAGAIISTYQAIAKALASAPWPASALLAARAALEGWAQVRAIQNSQPGWAHGTPGLDFRDFGSASLSVLHGQEAVVPRGGGHLLAAEIAAAMPGSADGSESLDRLDRIAAGIDALPRTLKRAIRDGLLLAT